MNSIWIRDGKFVYRREPDKFNASTFFAFLKKLRTISSRSGRRVVLIIDNVRHHHANLHLDWREKCRKLFALEFMPPYSSELKPIERVWKLTRRKATHNRYFPTLGNIIKAVEAVFNQWRNESDVLKQLSAIN